MIRGAQVTVGTEATAVRFLESDAQPGQTLLIQNPNATVVYLGGDDVTTSDYGHALAQDGVLTIDVPAGSVLYAVAGSEVDVNVLALDV